MFRSTIANQCELFLPFLSVKRDKISLSEDSNETVILDYGKAADLAFHQHTGSLRERGVRSRGNRMSGHHFHNKKGLE